MTNKKGIVFCYTCRKIVDDSFPTNHSHGGLFGNGRASYEALMRGDSGLGFFVDTPKMRKHLTKEFPPRKIIEVPV